MSITQRVGHRLVTDELRSPTAGDYARPIERESQILALILKVGADIPEISRQSGIPLETVRYLYKEHILKRRMRVQRELDHDKLGLKHIQFIVTADPELEPLFYNNLLCFRCLGRALPEHGVQNHPRGSLLSGSSGSSLAARQAERFLQRTGRPWSRKGAPDLRLYPS